MRNFYVSLIVLIFVITSCKKKVECPAFDSADLHYFPYKQIDTLSFLSSNSDTFMIYIQKIEQSESYEYTCKDLHKICPCLNSVSAIVTDSKSSQQYEFLVMEQSDVSALQNFKYNILQFTFEFDFKNELPYIQQIPFMKYIGNYMIEDRTYYEVIEITNTDNTTTPIAKLYFNKANGIIRWNEKGNGKIWHLTETE